MLAADHARFKAEGTEIIAISVDKPEKNSELAKKLKVPFPVLSDPDHKVIDAYDLLNAAEQIAKPAVFILDRKGIIRWSFLNEDYKIRPFNDALLAELKKID